MLSKLYGEAMCAHSGVPYTVVRPHNIYGPRMGLSHVVPELLKRAWESAEGEELLVYSPDHRRTFCYVDDAVEIIALASLEAQCENVVLNVGKTQPEYTMREVGELAVATVGRELTMVDGPETPGSPARRCPDTSRTESLVATSARTDLPDGMRLTYDWYRSKVFEAGLERHE
jgi:UDP-glucose 4-epimerase